MTSNFKAPRLSDAGYAEFHDDPICRLYSKGTHLSRPNIAHVMGRWFRIFMREMPNGREIGDCEIWSWDETALDAAAGTLPDTGDDTIDDELVASVQADICLGIHYFHDVCVPAPLVPFDDPCRTAVMPLIQFVGPAGLEMTLGHTMVFDRDGDVLRPIWTGPLEVRRWTSNTALLAGMEWYLQMTDDAPPSATRVLSGRKQPSSASAHATARLTVRIVTWPKSIAYRKETKPLKTGGVLKYRHSVRGHFVNQFCGPDRGHVRMFRKPHLKGPEGAPMHPGRVNVVKKHKAGG